MLSQPILQKLSNNRKIDAKRIIISCFVISVIAYKKTAVCQILRYGQTKMRYHGTTSTLVMIKPRKINGLKKLFVLSKSHMCQLKNIKLPIHYTIYVQIN